MKEIELLVEHIEDELEDARTYVQLALKYKTADPETATLFYKLSQEEMTHMDALHKRVVASIENYRKLKGEAPEGMKALYDFMHKREIAQAENIASLQNMFKKL